MNSPTRTIILPERRPEKAQAQLVRRALEILRGLDPAQQFEENFTGLSSSGVRFEHSPAQNIKIIATGVRQRKENGETNEWLENIVVRITENGEKHTLRIDVPHNFPDITYTEIDGRLESNVHLIAHQIGTQLAFPDVETSIFMGCPIIEPVEIHIADHPVTSAICEMLFYHAEIFHGNLDADCSITPITENGARIFSTGFSDPFQEACQYATQKVRQDHPSFLLGRLVDEFGTLVLKMTVMKPVDLHSIPSTDAMRAMQHVAFLNKIQEAVIAKDDDVP